MKTTAIIVAAGTGSRFGSQIPKQFIDLAGRPLIEHTLERFQSADSIQSIVLVLASEQVGKHDFPFDKIERVVAGGSTRAKSVRNGLAEASGADIVAVHDGARPFVTADEIDRTVAKAVETGAACLVAPVTDTIKSISGSEIAATLDRGKLRRALTPQCFRADVLRRAYEMADLTEAVTDECYMVEKLGYPISLVDGSLRNIKITTPEDLLIAEAIMNTENRPLNTEL